MVAAPAGRNHRRALSLILALALVGCAAPNSDRGAGPATSTTSATVAPTSTSVPPSATTATTGSTTSTRPPAPTTSAGQPADGQVAVITVGATSRSVVALTFDAGSDPGNASQILDVLAQNGIQATFGLTGAWAEANPALLRRIVTTGNQVVDHTWDHRSFTGYSTGTGPLTAAEISYELRSTDRYFLQASGVDSKGWFRPPYGDRSAASDAASAAAGYRYELMWTVDTLGWKGVSPSTVVQRALSSLRPGEIILMHVGSASSDASALPALITAIRARGYGFVTAANLAK
jgi:peptidoglycan/xylan/chitin deacetylase (PgdA/CDA1 family)